jgi:zinc finger protein
MAELPVGEGWQKGDENDLSMIYNCYCPNCGNGNAVTIMLPTKVPLFRELIIMNLHCDDCHFINSEVNFGGEIQERGERLTLTVTSYDDLNRQVIKSDSATLCIPQLDAFEIPPSTQRGTITTLEGVLKTAADNLQALQPERLRLGDVDNFHRCRRVIRRLRKYAGGAPSLQQGDNDNNDNDDTDTDDDDDEMEKGDEKNKSIFPFTVILDDPAGNSFIENLMAPELDPQIESVKYFRTPTQDMSLGLQPSQQAVEEGKIDDLNPAHKNIVNVGASAGVGAVAAAGGGSRPIETDPLLHSNKKKKHIKDGDDEATPGRQEVMKFPTSCPHCHVQTETDMCITDIPHFKEIIIMSMLCESCGFKSNEIKGGGAIPRFGSKITVTISQPDDLAREVLKSDTAGIAIPEVELELEEGGLDGLYTTMEGLLHKIRDRLVSANPFGSGDSARQHHLTNDGGDFSGPSPNHARYLVFLQKLHDMADGKMFPFTVIISDPLSNSFVGPIPRDAIALSFQAEKEGNHQCYEDYHDPGMMIEEYERSHDQNEILGLNDMKTENYQIRKKDGAVGLTTLGGGGDDKNDPNNSNKKEYYGTDKLQELPDRIRRLDIRGPDHPHQVGKAPVEGDNTVMGANSLNFAVPSMGKRDTTTTSRASGGGGVVPTRTTTNTTNTETSSNQAVLANATTVDAKSELQRLIHGVEYHDDSFMMNESYDGAREGMVYKDGAQGVGYYKDIPLLQLWEQSQQQQSMSTENE